MPCLLRRELLAPPLPSVLMLSVHRSQAMGALTTGHGMDSRGVGMSGPKGKSQHHIAAPQQHRPPAAGGLRWEHQPPLDGKPLASLGQTPHLLLPEGLVRRVGPQLGPFPTVPGRAPAWALDVQLPGGLMWQLGADQPRADGNGFPGCRQLTSGAGLRCHGAWPGEPGGPPPPGTWPPPAGGSGSPVCSDGEGVVRARVNS